MKNQQDGLAYKELVKIEDTEIINKIQNIVNSAVEHEFCGAFGFDMPPYAVCHLKNGNKITIAAVDNFEMEGETKGNYIMVTVNNDEDNKKIYKIEDKLEAYFEELYKK